MSTRSSTRPHNLLHCILRVRHTRSWPSTAISREFHFHLPMANGGIEVHLQHYDATDNAAIARSRSLWRFHPDPPVLGHVGNKWLSTHGKGGSLPLSHFGTQARPGETDITVSGWSDEDIAWMPDTLRATAYAAAVSLGIQLDDVVVAVTDPLEFASGATPANDRTFEVSIRKNIDDPTDAAVTAISCAMARVIDGAWWNTDRGRLFPRIARRMMKAVVEPDPIDRYIDYWLVAEFAAAHVGNKDISHALKHVLANHLGLRTRRQIANLHDALRLKQLEQQRNDIVHGSIDYVDPADLMLLESIANELVHAELGLPYLGSAPIDSALAGRQATTRLRRRPNSA